MVSALDDLKLAGVRPKPKGFRPDLSLDPEFVKKQADLDRLDAQLTDFRIKNSGRLPEQLQLNISALGSIQSQLGSVSEALNRNTQEKITLETALQTYQNQYDSLASMAPTVEDAGMAVKNERLIMLNRNISDYDSRLAGLRELYTDSYPEIKHMKAQINAWKRERDDLQKQEEAAEPKAKPVLRRVNRPGENVKGFKKITGRMRIQP